MDGGEARHSARPRLAKSSVRSREVSEFEKPERVGREPTVEDVRELMGPSTPHFAPHIRNRIRNLIADLPEGHPARVEGEMHIARLEKIAFGGESRGPSREGERSLPSVRGAPDS
jgi:hypothetical protein